MKAIATIYYDASCGLCTASTRRWGPMLARHGMEMHPLQDPDAQQLLGLQPGEVPAEMKLRTQDGRVLGGADALLFIARRIWWAYPAFLLSLIPGMKWVMRRLYGWVARNRHVLSGACRLSAKN